MNSCSPGDLIFLQYIGGELCGRELEDFRRHLQVCDNCQTRLAEERELTMVLRRSCPLYEVPSTLRARVSAMLAEPLAISRDREPGPNDSGQPAECPGNLAINARAAQRIEQKEKRLICACFQRLRNGFRRR